MFGRIVMVLIGLLFFSFSAYLIYRGIITKRFQQTEGVVLSSELISHLGDDEASYEPLIHYEYSIDGKRYQNSVYSVAPSGYNKRKAQKIIDNFEPGRIIKVYFNPEKMEDSVLSVGLSTIDTIGIIIMVSLLLFAIIEMLYF